MLDEIAADKKTWQSLGNKYENPDNDKSEEEIQDITDKNMGIFDKEVHDLKGAFGAFAFALNDIVKNKERGGNTRYKR